MRRSVVKHALILGAAIAFGLALGLTTTDPWWLAIAVVWSLGALGIVYMNSENNVSMRGMVAEGCYLFPVLIASALVAKLLSSKHG